MASIGPDPIPRDSTNHAISDSTYHIKYLAHELRELAFAFERVGNEKVAGELLDKASGIITEANNITAAWSRHISQGLTEAQRGVGETLVALVRAADNDGGERKGTRRKGIEK